MTDYRLYHKLSIRDAALAGLSGVMLALAFPKFGLVPLAWFGLVPLLLVLRRVGPRSGFWLGAIAGSAFFLILTYWIALFGFLPYLLLALIESLQFAAFAALGALCYRRRGLLTVIALPALWTGLEWIKTLGAFAFPWGGFAYSQAPWASFVQLARVTGPWGLSFLIVLVNVALAESLAERDKRSKLVLAGTIVLVAITSLAGWFYIRSFKPVGRSVRVAIVQGGVPLTWASDETLRRVVQTYWPMTEGIHGRADLIIWPESALPGDMLGSPELRASIAGLAQMNRAYILLGGYHTDRSRAGSPEYNGAYLLDPDGRVRGAYYKVHLVPFGEFVPGRSWLPLLEHYRADKTDRSPGPGFNTVRTKFGDIGTSICFESTFPGISREYVRRGAGLLAVITNDSWFEQTAACAQHHQFAVLQAVETGRYVLRGATTGISSIIAPTGEVKQTAGVGEKAVVYGEAKVLGGETPYVRFGDWFAYVSLAIGLIAAVLGLRKTPTGHSC